VNRNVNFDNKSRIQFEAFVNTKSYKPIYFNNNSINERQALEQRVLKQTPVPTELLDDFVDYVDRNLFKFIPRKRIFSDTITTYLKNSNAAVTVKKSILAAHSKFVENGVNQYTNFSKKDLHKMTTRKSFVKVENLNYQSPHGVLQKAPRLIQGGSPEYISLVGPFFSAFQRHVKSCWGKDNFIHFASGAKASEIGLRIDLPGWDIFNNDVSSYDSSIDVKICELEVRVAKRFGAPKAVLDLMLANIKTHGYTSTGWKYSVNGTRKSGDPYTSVFNSIINALMHCFVFHSANGHLTVEQVKTKMVMVVQGDDNILRHQGPRIDWKKPFLDLGFKTDSLYRNSIYDAEFCSGMFVETTTGLTLVPLPGKVLSKFGYFINPPMNLDPRTVLNGVIEGMKHLRFIRFYDEFYKAAKKKRLVTGFGKNLNF